MFNFESPLCLKIEPPIGCIGVRFIYHTIRDNIAVLPFFHSKEERLVESNKCLYANGLTLVDETKYPCPYSPDHSLA